jgi:hypothetical protein
MHSFPYLVDSKPKLSKRRQNLYYRQNKENPFSRASLSPATKAGNRCRFRLIGIVVALGSRQFQRGGLRDNRRRRLLIEEVHDWEENGIPSSPLAGENPRQPPPYYGEAALMDEQKRLIDFIPRRLPGVAAVSVAGLVSIAGLMGLHYWRISASARFPEGAIRALNLAAAGNLAQWFSSLLLLAASVAALLVYSIRRQRNDDYQGRYRVWLWAALCWFALATDVSVGVNRSLQLALVHLTGASLWKDGVLWWIVPYAVIFAGLGSRLVLDMWPCRLAIAAFTLATGSYLVALLSGLGFLPDNWISDVVMLQAGAGMLGHLSLLLAMILEARYVLLDFEGLLPPRPPKAAKPRAIKAKSEEEDVDGGPWRRGDSPQGTPQPAFRRTAPAASPVFAAVDEDQFEDDDPPNPTNRKLTKQEKKALKQRLLRERAEREKKLSKW